MNKKQVKKLVELSYTKNVLDEEKTMNIAAQLTRSNLKKYIKEIKASERNKRVKIIVPAHPSKEVESHLKQLFENKTIQFEIDPAILLGMKIIDNDLITEYNLKHTLETMKEYLAE